MKLKLTWSLVIKCTAASGLLIAAMGTAVFFVWKTYERKDIAELLVSARQLYEKREFPAAAQKLSKVLESDPNNEEALRIFAEMCEQDQRYATAGAVWRRLMLLNPLDTKLVMKYVTSMNIAQKFHEVITFLGKEEKKRELTAAEQVEFARAELNYGQTEAAQARFQKLRAEDCPVESYALLSGDMALFAGQIPDAEKCFHSLVSDKVSKYYQYSALLRLARLSRDKAVQERYLHQVYALYPMAGVAELGEFLLEQGRFDEAQKLLEGLSRDGRSFRVIQQLGEAAVALNQPEKLSALIQAVPVTEREGIMLKNYLEAMDMFVKQKFPEVRQRLKSSPAYASRGLYQYMTVASAVALRLEPAILGQLVHDLFVVVGEHKQSSEKLSELFCPLLNEYMRTGKLQEAWGLERELLEHGSEYTELRKLYLQTLLLTGKTEARADDVAARMLESDPKSVAALEYQVSSAAARNDVKALQVGLERLLKVQPDSFFGLLASAALADGQGRLQDAEAFLRKNEQLHPADSRTWNHLYSYLHRRNRKDAVAYAESCEKSADVTKQAFGKAVLGELAMEDKKPEEARTLYRAALKLDPKMNLIFLRLANLETDPQSREKVMMEGLSANPDDYLLTSELARMYALNNQDAKAAELYAKLLPRAGKDVLVLINYAETLAALNRTAEAMEIAVKAKILAPQDPRVRECFTVREFESGHYEGALAEAGILPDAVRKGPRIRKVMLDSLTRLASGAMKDRDAASAVSYFDELLKLDPDSEKAKEGRREALRMQKEQETNGKQ